MNCPRHYNLASMPAACVSHCPIRRGIQVPERVYTAEAVIQPGAPGHGRLTRKQVYEQVKGGRMARLQGKRGRDVPNIPECGVYAYLLAQDHAAIVKRERAQARQVLAMRGIIGYRKGARMGRIVAALLERDKQRKAMADGAGTAGRLLNDSEIADLAGVSRECVGYHKRKLGLT